MRVAETFAGRLEGAFGTGHTKDVGFGIVRGSLVTHAFEKWQQLREERDVKFLLGLAANDCDLLLVKLISPQCRPLHSA